MKANFSDEVADALSAKLPIVALESTVVAHGLPYPQNLETSRSLEKIIRDGGATPATIAVFGGECFIGLDDAQLERLASDKNIRKISPRDLAIAAAKKLDCATTVATTAFFAHRTGIKVFATGGIGGVHRGFAADVSADLPALANTPITVVCSGAKIVLDLAQTREWLETHGIPVLGWQCDEMPAFYSKSSSLPIDERVESAGEIADIVKARDKLDLRTAILVTVPVPAKFEVERSELETILDVALAAADKQDIAGKETTPFLLSHLSALSSGRTLAANIALLENNASVAAEIAVILNS